MTARPAPSRRAYWLKKLHQWHWISSALCLLGMLAFAITGWTLNNAGLIESRPRVVTAEADLPADMLRSLHAAAGTGAASAGGAQSATPPSTTPSMASSPSSRRSKVSRPLPDAVAQWLGERFDTRVPRAGAEWSSNELYISLPRPGGDAWMAVDLESGHVEYERTDRGAIAYLNDLHKGRHAGTAWSWFIDVFALACLVFSLTGLLLLKLHAGHRRATWPMVGLGVLVPVLLAATFIH
jgi:hypothetical protein